MSQHNTRSTAQKSIKMGKADETKKAQTEQLRSEIVADVTAAVTSVLSKRIEDLHDLITDKDTGIKPRLDHVEQLVEKGENNMATRLQKLELTVQSLETIIGKADSEHPFADGMQKEVITLKTQITTLQHNPTAPEQPADFMEFQKVVEGKFEVHGNAIGVLESHIKDHDGRITMNMARLMSDNIKIGGIAESYGENCMLVASKFFENIMGLPTTEGDIVDASRMKGALRRKIKGKFIDYPRLLFVKCSPTFRKKVESRKFIIKDKRDEQTKIKYTIRNHLPDSHYAVRLKYNDWVRHIFDENEGKPAAEQQTFAFKGEKFFVNGKEVVERILPPTLQEVCALSTQQQNELDAISFTVSDWHEEKGSKFKAFVTTAESIEHIEKCYLKMRKDFMTASHVCMGYRIDDEDSTPIQGAVSDGEHQADVRIISTMYRSGMNNIVVFVVRRYGGVHIGGLRLTLIQKVTIEALGKLKEIRGDITEVESVRNPDDEETDDDGFTTVTGSAPKRRATYGYEPLSLPPKSHKTASVPNTRGGFKGGRGRLPRAYNVARMNVVLK